MDLKTFRDSLHYLNFKDQCIRKKCYKKELKLNLLKTLYLDKRLTFKLRYFLKNYLLILFNRRLSMKIHSRCLLTGKSRFVFRYFRLNRSSLKLYSSFGFISGFRKW
jgi:ribosomal protein S14